MGKLDKLAARRDQMKKINAERWGHGQQQAAVVPEHAVAGELPAAASVSEPPQKRQKTPAKKTKKIKSATTPAIRALIDSVPTPMTSYDGSDEDDWALAYNLQSSCDDPQPSTSGLGQVLEENVQTTYSSEEEKEELDLDRDGRRQAVEVLKFVKRIQVRTTQPKPTRVNSAKRDLLNFFNHCEESLVGSQSSGEILQNLINSDPPIDNSSLDEFEGVTDGDPFASSSTCNLQKSYTDYINAVDSHSLLVSREEEVGEVVVEVTEPLHGDKPLSEAYKRYTMMEAIAGTTVLDESGMEENLFANLRQVNRAVTELAVCKHCKSHNWVLETKATQICTYNKTMIARCRNCSRHSKPYSTSATMSVVDVPNNKFQKKKTKVNNVRFTLAVLTTGIGYAKANEFCSLINTPTLSYPCFLDTTKAVIPIIRSKVQQMFEGAATEVAMHYRNHLQMEETDGGMDISVTFDGSWMTRGHSSLYGVSFVIDGETGIILDYYIASKYCHQCTVQKKLKLGQEYEQWLADHTASGNCLINYDPTKSSGGMEAVGATVMFKRSMEKRLRYAKLVSDEDSSTFASLKRENVYGDNHPITKINCLNHISKKIYRKLDEARVKHKLGGVGEGKLTQRKITAFAHFYRAAVKYNVGNNLMIKIRVLGFLFHNSSTDEVPMHHLCSTKYCKYKRDLNQGIQPQPGWHANLTNRPYSLNANAAEAVYNVMESMLTDDVLNMVSGKTQNINESLHSKLWNVVPKTKFLGRDALEFAVCQTILKHNCGVAAAAIHNDLNIPFGKEMKKGTDKRERRRTKILKPKKPRAVKRKEKEAAKKSKDYASGQHE